MQGTVIFLIILPPKYRIISRIVLLYSDKKPSKTSVFQITQKSLAKELIKLKIRAQKVKRDDSTTDFAFSRRNRATS